MCSVLKIKEVFFENYISFAVDGIGHKVAFQHQLEANGLLAKSQIHQLTADIAADYSCMSAAHDADFSSSLATDQADYSSSSYTDGSDCSSFRATDIADQSSLFSC